MINLNFEFTYDPHRYYLMGNLLYKISYIPLQKIIFLSLIFKCLYIYIWLFLKNIYILDIFQTKFSFVFFFSNSIPKFKNYEIISFLISFIFVLIARSSWSSSSKSFFLFYPPFSFSRLFVLFIFFSLLFFILSSLFFLSFFSLLRDEKRTKAVWSNLPKEKYIKKLKKIKLWLWLRILHFD